MNSPRLCTTCLNSTSPITSTTAPLIYSGVVRELIHRWKFEGASELTALLMRLALASGRTQRKIDMVVPIPMHWVKRMKRGYNQAELIAYEWSRAALGQAPLANVLTLNRRGLKQHALNRHRRKANAEGRFRIVFRKAAPLTVYNLMPSIIRSAHCEPNNLMNKCVLLVDDVLTTGSTAEAAAKALRSAGASKVHVWCLARSHSKV